VLLLGRRRVDCKAVASTEIEPMSISSLYFSLTAPTATGKGVPAALVMSTTCGMLQLAAQALDSFSPGEVLAQVNETLFSRIPPNMFVTCIYAILDPSR
jgi:serine phosphatase RsbU (regulator of sigma subunit)